MRRGGPILLVLVLIIVILIAVAFLVLNGIGPFAQPKASPTAPLQKIVIVGQPINRDDKITAESLSSAELPKNLVTQAMITDPNLVIGKYAAFPLKQGWPLSLDMVSERPGMNQPGSEAAKVIQPGQVAISIPINRLDSVAYAIRDGDYVNIIATTLFVDLDPSFQTLLPNNLGIVTGPGPDAASSPRLVAGGEGPQGRIDLEPTLNQPIYVIPAETKQRPRLVSQMVLQDIQVLHIGTFSITSGEAQPAPDTTGQGAPQPTATAIPVARPDIITLIVSPQDAVSLTYLLYSGAKLTLTLRAPDDRSRAETEAATLQYLLSQYAIPVPAKLPYGMEPRLDSLATFVEIPLTPTPRP